jgi:Ino eighty subunit 1
LGRIEEERNQTRFPHTTQHSTPSTTMASLSALLNPSGDSDEPNAPPTSTAVNNTGNDQITQLHAPTSVSELLIAAHPEHNSSSSDSAIHSQSAVQATEAPRSSLLPVPTPVTIKGKPKLKAKKEYRRQNPSTGATYNALDAEGNETDGSKAYQTLLINARSRHLKKNDGEPYWRNEVQFQFLMSLFFNYDRVFTNPYWGTADGFDWPRQFYFYKDQYGILHENHGEMLTFFEIYVVTLLKSSKISKILKARLMSDIGYALNFAIICLLVNIGRLNTTVNFDYEMKSQFRTYHSIPSLQVGDHQSIIKKYYQLPDEYHTDIPEQEDSIINSENTKKTGGKSKPPTSTQTFINGSGYTMSTVKQLQDTPRIKSILKSVNDISDKAPKTFAQLIEAISSGSHKFNIISIIFLICSHEYDVGRSFFPFEMQNQPSPSPPSSSSSPASSSSTKTPSTGSILNDIWLKPKLKASDKVKKFLWLLYTLMETNLSFTKILNNPFNEISAIPNELMANRDNIDLAHELATVVHKKPYVSETIMKIESIIPQWTLPVEGDKIDPYINDFDTNEEVEFAAQMKKLRTSFVEQESQNTTITSIHHNSTAILADITDHDLERTQIPSSHIIMEDLPKPTNIRGSQSNRTKRMKNDQSAFAPHIYHPGGAKGYSRQKAMESATNNNAYPTHDTPVLSDADKPDSYEYDDLSINSQANNNNQVNETELENSHLQVNEATSPKKLKGKKKRQADYDSDEEYIDEDDLRGDLDDASGLVTHQHQQQQQQNQHLHQQLVKNTNDSSYFDGMIFVDPSSKRGVKRPNDESLEFSAIDPIAMSSYEDNSEEGGSLGFFNYGYPGLIPEEDVVCDDGSMMLTSCVRKRKTRRQVNVEPAVKATIERFEMYLNKDNKSVNSTSKNALLKREKNRTIAEFMLELVRHKQLLAKELRHEEGNWKHFTKHLWDLNIFVEKEHTGDTGYGDWGEFKTTMMKAMNHINWVINERIRIDDKVKQHTKKDVDTEVEPTFVDTIFASL